MKTKRFPSILLHTGAIIFCGLWLWFVTPATVSAQDTQDALVEVVSSSAEGIVLRLTVPEYVIEPVERNGMVFHRVTIPSTVQTDVPGAPQAPTLGTMIGLPHMSGASLSVLNAEYETLRGYQLLPAPRFVVSGSGLDDGAPSSLEEVFELNAELYATDALYPSAPVELGEVSLMRDQAVAPVHFYPVQSNPASGELRIYRQLDVEITWQPTAQVSASQDRGASPAYEALLAQSLINYPTLTRPAIATPSPNAGVDPAVIDADSATSPTLKIGVDVDGIYRITYDELKTAGFDPDSIDPRKLRMTNKGATVPILVTGEGDGVFNSEDSILFYGTAIRDFYTTRNIYWLRAGTSNGLRMAVQDGSPSGSPATAKTFPTSRHFEEDTIYWQPMPNGEGQDHFFWRDRVSPDSNTLPTSRTYTVMLGFPATTTAKATVRVQLKGYTKLDHRTKIYLNNTKIDDQKWTGQIVFDHEVKIAHSLLQNGANDIRVESVDAGAAVDQLLINWIEVDYRNTYKAEGNQLRFGPPKSGPYQYAITEFNRDDLSLFDISDPAKPVVIANVSVVSNAGKFTLRFGLDATASSRFLALSSDQYKSASTIELDQPSAWKSTANGADYIIITHESFYTETLALANFRSGQGLRVATVRVGDLYDEFNDGIYNTKAIRDFLAYAYAKWQAPAPTYVVLVGDAYHDHRGVLGSNTFNYVPAEAIETDLFGQVPSDNWYVAISGDDILPDMFVGRLSAITTDDAAAMVANIIAYETTPPTAPWNSKLLLIADDDDPAFKLLSDILIEKAPFYYGARKVNAGTYPPGDPSADINTAINSGKILVNYTGHGEVRRWGVWKDGYIYDRNDIAGLVNSGKLPFVTAANCLSGYFSGSSDFESMAEVFQRTEGKGAIGVWAPTSLGYPSGHRVLMGELYDAIFQMDKVSLGAATSAAKLATFAQSTFWGELIETYVLFGDPVTELGIPTNYPYVESVQPPDGTDNVPIDQTLQVVFNKQVDPAVTAVSGAGNLLTPVWSNDHTVLTLEHPDLSHGATYNLSVSGADQTGNPLGTGPVPSSWSFTVTSDDVPPSASIEVEGELANAIPLTATIQLSFSEPMRQGSVVFSLQPYISGYLSWSPDGRAATFRLQKSTFQYEIGQTYTFKIESAKDMAGNLMPPVQKSFAVQQGFSVFLPNINTSK